MKSTYKNNPILLVIILLVVLFVIGTVMPYLFSGRMENYESGEWNGPGHMMGMGGFWMFPFFPIIIIIVVLYLLFGRETVSWSRHLDHDAHPERSESALDIVRKRYAKGEISKEEFEQLNKDLSK